MEHKKQFLINYGFSDIAIKALLTKGKYTAPYGEIKIIGNELVTIRKATKEIIKESII